MALRSLENRMSSLETSSKAENKPLLIIKKKQTVETKKRTKRNILLDTNQSEETNLKTDLKGIGNQYENAREESTANHPDWFRLFDDHKIIESSSSEEQSKAKLSAVQAKREEYKPSPCGGKRRRVTRNNSSEVDSVPSEEDSIRNKENFPLEQLETPQTPFKSCIVITKKARQPTSSANSFPTTFERIVRSVEKKKPAFLGMFQSNLDDSLKLPANNVTTDFTIFEDEVIPSEEPEIERKRERKTRVSSRATLKSAKVKYEPSESEESESSQYDGDNDDYLFKPSRKKMTFKKATATKKEATQADLKAKTQRQINSTSAKATSTKSSIKTNTTSSSKQKNNKVQEQIEKEELERLAKEYDEIKNYKLIVETVSHDYDL
jgi:hypothetical protein